MKRSIMIAAYSPARVIGTASASKHDELRALGVDELIDYRTEDFEVRAREMTNGRGVELILDAIGGASFKKGYRLLAPTGRLGMFGISSAVMRKERQPSTRLPATKKICGAPPPNPRRNLAARNCTGKHRLQRSGRRITRANRLMRWENASQGSFAAGRNNLLPVLGLCYGRILRKRPEAEIARVSRVGKIQNCCAGPDPQIICSARKGYLSWEPQRRRVEIYLLQARHARLRTARRSVKFKSEVFARFIPLQNLARARESRVRHDI
jgi:hypothetical protein